MSRSFIESSAEISENATQTVAGCLESIRESSDFYQKLTQNDSLTVSGLGDRYYVKGIQEYFMSKRIPIPPELSHQISNMRNRFAMGLFPEISRAWVTIDCDIFMWNYESNDDLAYFDGIPNTIFKIALAKPKAGVFQSHVQWLLIVATATDVSLLAMSTSGGELSLVPDPLFKVDLENAVVNDIVATSDGRVFFNANDVLYELEYADKGWFQRSCKKVNRSTKYLQSLIPFLSPVAEEIEQVVVDNSRHLLYTLTKTGSIQVYDLGAAQNTNVCNKSASLSIGNIVHECQILSGQQHDSSFFSKMVMINAIEASASHHINLVATSSMGVRMYFSVLPRNARLPGQNANLTQAEARPHSLRIVHIRFAPGVCPLSAQAHSPQGVYSFYGNSSTTVMAVADREEVFTFSTLYNHLTKFHVETQSQLSVSGPVWSVALNSGKILSPPQPAGGLLPNVDPHPFYTLHAQKTEELLLLTSEFLHVFVHVSPVDALREALHEKGAESAEVARMWSQFGPADTLVLALMILASDKPVDGNVKEKAARLFFSWKDEPEMVDADMLQREAQWSNNDHSIADWQTRIRSPLQASTPFGERMVTSPLKSPFSPNESSFIHGNTYYQFKSSKRHDALYAYFSRLVAPVWFSPICVHVDGRLVPVMTDSDLEWLSGQLRALLHVIDEFGLIPRPTQSRNDGNMQTKFNAEALSRERTSLSALRSLIVSTCETLSLWSTAISQGLNAISASIDPQFLPTLAGKRICELSSDASHLNSELIKALIKYFLGDEAGTKDLSDRLRAVCPTLYSQDDALVTNAMEILERAVKQGPGSGTRRLIEQAVSLLKQSVHKLTLASVCGKLAQLKSYEAIVELAIMRAKRDDPKQLALIAYRNGLGEGDRETAEALNRREEAYSSFTRALDDMQESRVTIASADVSVYRDLIIQCVLSSDDELAHAALFRWLLSRNLSKIILASQSAFVEQFLTQEISRGGGHRYLDLLWRFYERTGSFDKAAKLLSRLADSQMAEIGLSQRFAYLSHAIICAQAATDASTKGTIQEMRDKLEVANIQIATKEALEQLGPEASSAAKSLDKQLLSLQELCLHFARPYNLWKVQLAIFNCANYYEQQKIHDVWTEILDQELKSSSGSIEQRLLTTLSDLAAKYAPSNYFPQEFIIVSLLFKCFERHVSPEFFVSLLPKTSLSISQFLEYLTNEYRTGDPFWKENARARQYVMDVAVATIERFLDEPTKYTPQQRSSLAAECAACVSLFSLDARSLLSSAPMIELERKLIILNERLSMI